MQGTQEYNAKARATASVGRRGMRRKGESSNENRGHEGETDTLRASGKASWRKSPGRGGFKYMRLGRRDRQEKEQGPGGGL